MVRVENDEEVTLRRMLFFEVLYFYSFSITPGLAYGCLYQHKVTPYARHSLKQDYSFLAFGECHDVAACSGTIKCELFASKGNAESLLQLVGDPLLGEDNHSCITDASSTTAMSSHESVADMDDLEDNDGFKIITHTKEGPNALPKNPE